MKKPKTLAEITRAAVSYAARGAEAYPVSEIRALLKANAKAAASAAAYEKAISRRVLRTRGAA